MAEEAEVVQDAAGTEALEPGELIIPETPEFDYSMDPAGEAGEESEDVGAESSDPEGQPSSTAPEPAGADGTLPEPAAPSAVSPQDDRLAALERRANEAEARLQRALSHLPDQADPDAEPPKPKDKLQTAQDVAEYMEWYHRHQEKRTRAQASLDAAAASSEQRARGILSAQALGAGNDYDAMIARHLEPIERDNAHIRGLFGSMSDPALARYTFAFIREIAGQFKGDPVKTFTEIRKAMGARKAGAQDMVDKIEKAARTGADKIRSKVSRPGKTPGGKLSANDIQKLTRAQYLALEKRLASGN